MLDLTRLRVLVAVARTGSVTAAARELHYSQPSVSHHLARLETETGAKLVQRAGRGVRLTDAGRQLAERGAEILGRLEAAETELAAHVGLRQGRVRLAAFPSALGTFVPAAAARLAADHPGLELRLTEAEPPEAVRMLRAGHIDVAVIFRYDDSVPEDDGIVMRRLLQDPTYLVAAEPPTTELAAYADGPWIAGCDRCRMHLLELCARTGFEPSIAFTTDDFVAVQAMVAAGLGVATLPGLALRAARHPGVRVVALPDSPRYVLAATYGSPPHPPATGALLAALTEAAGG
ncbi:MAG TPA: LysR family transcriptional regulator [Streptosporangiaceae bacterium]|nr:LysR family transcriptional regulator [Streptosporangiaceae bacterium]